MNYLTSSKDHIVARNSAPNQSSPVTFCPLGAEVCKAIIDVLTGWALTWAWAIRARTLWNGSHPHYSARLDSHQMNLRHRVSVARQTWPQRLFLDHRLQSWVLERECSLPKPSWYFHVSSWLWNSNGKYRHEKWRFGNSRLRLGWVSLVDPLTFHDHPSWILDWKVESLTKDVTHMSILGHDENSAKWALIQVLIIQRSMSAIACGRPEDPQTDSDYFLNGRYVVLQVCLHTATATLALRMVC